LPADTPLVVVRDPDQDVEEIVWQAAKIGYESLAGELAGGMPAWTAAGLAAASTELVAPDQLAGRRVLDIRQREEFAGGHLPGAHHCELGALTDTQPTHLDSGLSGSDDPVVLMCGHGERAAGAASLLERAGHRDLAVLVGGPDDWARATGEDLDPGS
jgi:rhodanese-related sulfurtransferase